MKDIMSFFRRILALKNHSEKIKNVETSCNANGACEARKREKIYSLLEGENSSFACHKEHTFSVLSL